MVFARRLALIYVMSSNLPRSTGSLPGHVMRQYVAGSRLPIIARRLTARPSVTPNPLVAVGRVGAAEIGAKAAWWADFPALTDGRCCALPFLPARGSLRAAGRSRRGAPGRDLGARSSVVRTRRS